MRPDGGPASRGHSVIFGTAAVIQPLKGFDQGVCDRFYQHRFVGEISVKKMEFT